MGLEPKHIEWLAKHNAMARGAGGGDAGSPPPSPLPSPSPQMSTPSPSPQVSTPAPSPQVSTPAPSPQVSTPSPSPQVSTPAPSPQVSTPAPSPQMSTPVPSPQVATPSPSPVAAPVTGVLPATDTVMFFELDSADLTAGDTAVLDRYAAAYTAAGVSTPITVVGYASVDGASAHNAPLSAARAQAVAGYLASKGVPAVNIKASGAGETQSFSASDLRANRRAVIDPPAPQGATPSPQPGTPSPQVATPSPQVPPPSPQVPTPSPHVPTPSPAPSLLGFPVNVVIPVEFERPAWDGKIKIKLKGKIVFEAVVGGSKFPVTLVITADSAKVFGLKASQKWWEGHGKVTLGGITIIEKPTITTKEEANLKDGITVKAELSAQTPLGTLFVSGTVLQWTKGTGSKVGTIEGGIKGNKIPIANVEVEGITIHDIFISSEMSIEVAPQYVKIIADEAWDAVKSRVEALGAEVILDFALTAGLVAVAIGALAGTAQAIGASVDLMHLQGQTEYAYNSVIRGISAALQGNQGPTDPWGAFGYRIGQKVVDDAMAQATAKNPDASPVDVHDAVIDKTSRIKLETGDIHNKVVRIVGDQFWHGWADNNHGYTVFMGDAKAALAACYRRVIPDIPDNDPDLQYWSKQSKLPNALKE